MSRSVTAVTVAALVAVFAAGCSNPKDTSLSRDAVLPPLQQEAYSLKDAGEKPDTTLGVQATWNILGIDLKEQPGDPDKPWIGTIRFKIDSTMKEGDGTLLTQSFEKRFEYVYSAALKRWIIQYIPPSTPPAPPAPRS